MTPGKSQEGLEGPGMLCCFLRELQGCDAPLLELPALNNMVLITCSLSFYKLQIRINCFMESL